MMKNNLWNKLSFNCYHCGKLIDFSLLDENIISHLTEIKLNIEDEFKNEIEQTLEEKYKMLFDEKIATEKHQLEETFNLQHKNKVLELQKDFQSQLKDKETSIELLKNKITIQNDKYEKEIEMAVAKETNKILTELSDLREKNTIKKSENRELILQMENLRKSLDSEKQLILLNQEKETNERIENIKSNFNKTIDSLQKQIYDLDKANAINKAINSKIKGNNFENYFHEALKKTTALVNDKVEKITRTGLKADFIHEINNNGITIGSIVYELKDTEKWDSKWLQKFAEDILTENGDYGVLISNNVKEVFKVPFLQTENPKIYLSEPDSFEFVMNMIRKLIIVEKTLINNNQNDKLIDFKKWREGNFQTFETLFDKTMIDNEAREKTIANKLKEFANSREALKKAFEQKILNEIDNFLK